MSVNKQTVYEMEKIIPTENGDLIEMENNDKTLKPDTEKSVYTTKNSFENTMTVEKLTPKEFLKKLKENNPEMYEKLFNIYINLKRKESFESFIENNLLPLNISLKVEEWIKKGENIPCSKATNINGEIINFTSTGLPKYIKNHKLNKEEKFLGYGIPLLGYQGNGWNYK